MDYPRRVIALAERHPDALHYLYLPDGSDAMYCWDYGDNSHDLTNLTHCPFVSHWPNYLVVTRSDLLRPTPDTSHTLWRTA